ncbi:MAG: VIT1/CCC1 transporter family protein [Syntrophales bacterium]
MNLPHLDEKTRTAIEAFQEAEITEYHIYRALADRERDPGNSRVLARIGEDERRHYDFWKGYSGSDIAPKRLKVHFLSWVARIFGLTFGIKLMERGEERAQRSYAGLVAAIPEAERIAREEGDHERELIGMIEEERLRYTGSIVLGLSDALVELTGALAGFTFALQNVRLIAVTGLITGIAASFSMASSEYLACASEGGGRNPLKSSLYTFTAYLLTVALLVFPYFLFKNCYVALSVTVANVVLIILLFSFYVSVAKDLPFGKRFWEMTAISLGVAALSFGIGYLMRIAVGVDLNS